jgi:hypothetical protein
MVRDITIGGIYQHYKGKNYQVLGIARHSETLEELVIYNCLYENPEGKTWARPLQMFLENVVIDGKSLPRFRYIGDQKGKVRL